MARKEFWLIVGAYAVLILALIALCVVVINPALEHRETAPSTPIEHKEAA